MPKSEGIVSSMVGRRVKIRERLMFREHDPYTKHEGMGAEIVSVYQDAEHQLRYSVVFEDGSGMELYAAHAGALFVVCPKGAA